MNKLDVLNAALHKKSFFLSFDPTLEAEYITYSKKSMTSIGRQNVLYFFIVIASLFSLFIMFHEAFAGKEFKLLSIIVLANFGFVYICSKFDFFQDHVFKILMFVLIIGQFTIFVWVSTLPDDIRPPLTSVVVFCSIIFCFIIFRYNYFYSIAVCVVSTSLYFSYCFYTGFKVDWVYFRFNFFIPFVVGFCLGYINEKEERRNFLKSVILKLMYEKVSTLSRIDDLTQLFNRRHLNESARIEWSRAQRSQKPFSIVMVDIDYFKQYNDLYGHIEGDFVLQKLADALSQSIKRTTDTVYRFGGEEFVLVLYDTSKLDCLTVVERLQKNLLELAIPHEKSPFKYVTVSCGIYSEIPQANSRYEEALIAADKALYQAKAKGRNQYCFSDD